MSEQHLKIPRASDKTVAETFKGIATKYRIPKASVSALAFSEIGAVDVTVDPSGDWKTLLDYESELIRSMSISLGSISVHYHRGGRADPKSPIYDEISLSSSNNQPLLSNADKLDLVAFLNRALCAFEPSQVIGQPVSEEQGQLLAIHESTLKRLEALNEKLIEQGTEFRQRLEREYDEKVLLAEEKLASERERLQAENAKKVEAFDEREKAIAEKLKAIDDRNNTHARREIRDRMLEDVKHRISQFGVSVRTEQKRKPVLVGMYMLMATLAALLLWSIFEVTAMDREYEATAQAVRHLVFSDPDKLKVAAAPPEIAGTGASASVDHAPLYWLWARVAVLTFGLIATMLYYIRWQNKWAEHHAMSEFQLQQFYIDVNRANWVMESCLEWRKETDGSVIPKVLLSSITNGLFVNNQSEPERVVHPADELASALLGSASKIRLKAGDGELEFDKPNKITNKPVSVGRASNQNG